jgi:hypothetical protein
MPARPRPPACAPHQTLMMSSSLAPRPSPLASFLFPCMCQFYGPFPIAHLAPKKLFISFSLAHSAAAVTTVWVPAATADGDSSYEGDVEVKLFDPPSYPSSLLLRLLLPSASSVLNMGGNREKSARSAAAAAIGPSVCLSVGRPTLLPLLQSVAAPAALEPTAAAAYPAAAVS